MLTIEDLQQLSRPFPANEHYFRNGFAYIKELPVCQRITEVDPSWQFYIDEIANRDNVIITRARLEIKGVVRSNAGMDAVKQTKEGNAEANEAEKSASTDSLKRCARLFGVGQYLLSLPRSVIDIKTLEVHLNSINPTAPAWWSEITRAYKQHPAFAGDTEALALALKDLLSRDILQMTSPVVQVKAIVDASYSNRK